MDGLIYYDTLVFVLLAVPCISLDPPTNGALACDEFADGIFCSFSCNDGYDVPRLRGGSYATLYVCGATGDWNPDDNTPDCSGKLLTLPQTGNMTFLILCIQKSCIITYSCVIS